LARSSIVGKHDTLERVYQAIAVVKQQKQAPGGSYNPPGLLREALRLGWKPSRVDMKERSATDVEDEAAAEQSPPEQKSSRSSTRRSGANRPVSKSRSKGVLVLSKTMDNFA